MVPLPPNRPPPGLRLHDHARSSFLSVGHGPASHQQNMKMHRLRCSNRLTSGTALFRAGIFRAVNGKALQWAPR